MTGGQVPMKNWIQPGQVLDKGIVMISVILYYGAVISVGDRRYAHARTRTHAHTDIVRKYWLENSTQLETLLQ